MRFLRDMLHHAYYWKERAPGRGPGPGRALRQGLGAAGRHGGDRDRGRASRSARRGTACSARTGPATGSSTSRRPSSRSPSSRARAAAGSARSSSTRCSRVPGRRGTRRISLERRPHNAGAIELYERHGFEQVGETDDSVTMLAHLGDDNRQKGPKPHERDVAVLGGGPAGYTAAIRAAQLGGKVVCIEQEPELGGTCLRVGCIPTKAWVQSAHACHDARETFAKLGVQVGEPTLDFGTVASWKDGVVEQMTGGVASLFKANGVEWVKGNGSFTSPTTIAVEGAEDVTFKSAIVATGSYPVRPPIPGLDSPRCVDSTGLLAQTEVPRRLVVLGGGIIGCEFASIFDRFGTEVTIVEMLPTPDPAGGRGRGEGAREGVQEARDRAPPREAVHAGRRPRRAPDGALRRRRDGRVRPDARLGRAARRSSTGSASRRRASRSTGRESGPTTTGARTSRTSTRPATSPATGSSRTPASARARSRPRTRWATTRPSAIPPCRARSTPTPRSPASG